MAEVEETKAAGETMTTKRTNINQGGEKDEGQQAELNRPYRGIGSGHRGNQEKLDAKDSPDKNEALKRLEAKLEPVIRFFNGNAPENVNAISEARKPSRNTSNQ